MLPKSVMVTTRERGELLLNSVTLCDLSSDDERKLLAYTHGRRTSSVMQQTDTRLRVDTTQPSALPKKVIYILGRARTSPKIVCWAFLLFVFTIPFETIDLEAIRGASSLSRLAGLLVFSTCLLYPKACFRRPPQALWWFTGYASVYALSGFFIPEQFVGQFIEEFKTFVQLLVICWVSSTLLQEEKFARHTLLTFSIATLLVAIGLLLELPGFSRIRGGRVSVAGANPNAFAIIVALGAQALIGFGIEQIRRNIWMRVTFMALSLFPLIVMVYTGSRGGILAFLAGVVVYALPYRSSKRKMAAILGVTIAVVGVVYIVVNDQSTLSRLESTYNTGDTAGRDGLFAASVDMISEKPLLGWGAVVWTYELGPREGKGYKFRGAHNLILDLLMECGLLGAILCLIGLGLCVRAAWTARVHSLGLLALAWLITMIIASMSGPWLGTKSLWLVLALSLASGASTVKQYKRKNLMIRPILQDVYKRDTSFQ
jgi:O-antigen ligase